MFLFFCKGQADSGLRVRDIYRRKQQTFQTDDSRITELYLYFTNNAHVMTQQLLLATFMEPKSVTFESREKNGTSIFAITLVQNYKLQLQMQNTHESQTGDTQ